MSHLRPISKKRLAKAMQPGMVRRGTFIVNAKDDRRKAKNRAWAKFSMFVRLRDAGPDGYVSCVTCTRNAHWRTFDAGHFITRAKESTLFDERNVNAQCKGCNRFQGGKFLQHEQAIARKHGPTVPDELKVKAGRECRRTLSDYQAIEKFYAERVQWIRKHEPGKFTPTEQR